MLKKKLGTEAIERDWCENKRLTCCFKISPTLIIPEGCEKIGDYAFKECNIEEVIIPGSVRIIGVASFEWCYNLKKVVIPKSVEEIREDAFYDCMKATIILKKHKKDFKYIDDWAFGYCKYVKKEIRS